MQKVLKLSWEFHYRIEQFHSLFIGKGFGIENSYINLHDFDVKFIAFRHTNEKPIELKL